MDEAISAITTCLNNTERFEPAIVVLIPISKHINTQDDVIAYLPERQNILPDLDKPVVVTSWRSLNE